jgi:hypothetical protein
VSTKELLIELRAFVDQRSSETGYGYLRTKNPHDFSPDHESCTAEEIEAHKAACEAFDVGKYEHDGWDGWNEDHTIHVLKAPWGIGAYTYRDEIAENLIRKIDAALAATKTTGGAA